VSVAGDATLVVDGRSGNGLSAQYGSSITVSMRSSSSFDTTVYGSLSISRSGSTSVSQGWFIVTRES
jgi:hypothetical protein